MGKQHAFFDCRTKADHNNTIQCFCYFNCGKFSYRFIWDWAKNMPDKIKDGTVPNVASDPDGNIYVAERVKGYPIAKFTNDGTFIRYYGQDLDIDEIHGLYIDKDYNIWISDDVGNVIYKLNQNNELLLTLGEKGKASDTGVDMSIKSHLKYLSILRSAGPFNKPTKAVIDSAGNIFVSDGYANAAVHMFTPEGSLIKSWGAPGNAPGEFNIVHSVFVDHRNRIWIADRDNDRCQIFDCQGNLIKIIPGLLYPTDVWANETNVFVSEHDGRISIFDLDFQMVAQVGFFHAPYRIHSLCGDKYGNLYLGLFNEYPVVKLELQK